MLENFGLKAKLFKSNNDTLIEFTSLQACVNDLFGSTQLALDLTAPVKRASASFYHNDLLCAIASATTHQITSVHAHRCVVALTTMCALYSQSGILFTESGRGLQVHQIFHCWWLMVWIVWFQLEVVSVK